MEVGEAQDTVPMLDKRRLSHAAVNPRLSIFQCFQASGYLPAPMAPGYAQHMKGAGPGEMSTYS